jgi:hypothetical protein
MLSEAVFFSFAEVTDPGSHRAYNAWHQLDHRPENLALDGVRYGERWVRTPACAATSVVADPRLERTHYVNMYWFREPWQASFAQWQELAERSYQWGRRPDTGYAVRPFMGLFRTVRGRAAPRVLVSPDALPFRPARAVQLSVHRFETAHSPATHACLMDAESRRVPDLLAADGVAGVWTFSSISTTLDPSFQPAAESVTFGPSGADAGLFRMTPGRRSSGVCCSLSPRGNGTGSMTPSDPRTGLIRRTGCGCRRCQAASMNIEIS